MASTNSEASPSKSVDEWFAPWRFAALLATLLVVTYPEVIFLQATFFHRDFAAFGYPLAWFHKESFWQGEIPLWNPYNYCGLPFLAQWNTLTLYPLSLIYLLLPLSWALGMFSLSHFFLAGMGMYFLAHSWTQNRFAAAVAGLAFSFNSLMLNFLMWPNHIATMAWLPWFVLCALRAWREGGRWLLLAVLTGTMQMLSGAPEVILLTWIWLGALFLMQLSRRDQKAFRSQISFRFLAMGVWVACLAAAQLLPFLDMLRHSQRDQGFAGSEWAMPIWGWANFLVPLFRSLRTPLGVYAQPDQYCVPSYYLGAGVFALAMLALAVSRDKRTWLLGILTVGCLILALGNSGLAYAALKRLFPLIGFMRYPVKFVMLPAMLVPLLAAIFVRYSIEANQDQWLTIRRWLIGLGATFAGIIAIIIWAAFHYPLKGAEAHDAASSGITRAVMLILILASVVLLRQVRRPGWQTLARCAFLLLLWLDVMTAGPRPNPSVERWVYEPNFVARELHLDPKPRMGDGRAMLSGEAESNLSVTQMTNGINDVVYRRMALRGNLNILDEIPKLVGMYPLYFRELGEVLPALYAVQEPPAPLMDFLSVSYTNLPGKVTEWGFRSSRLPWITAGQQPMFADATSTLSALSSPQFDPRKTVFLPLESRPLVSVSNPSLVKVAVKQFSNLRIEFETDATEPAMVVIAQSYYHDWRAFVGGESVPLLRANHAFQAIQVPAGHHTVILRYQDRAFYGGVVLSLAAALAWIVLWIRSRKPQLPQS